MKEKRTLRYRWYMFAILLAAYFLVYFHRVAPSGVANLIVSDVGGSLTLIASVYFYVYLLMQIPSGLMTDRVGLGKLTFLFLSLAAVGTLTVSFADSFALVILGKIMVACGMAIVYIPLTKIIAVWFKKKDFATLNGSVIAVGNVGAIAAGAPFVALVTTMGWREVFLILGIITLLLAFLCLLVVRNRPSDIGAPEICEIYPDEVQNDIDKVSLRDGVLTAVKSGRAFWMPASAYFLIYGTIMVYQGLWAGRYFDGIYGFANFAWMISMVGVGKIISAALAGTVAKIVGSKRLVMISANIGYLCIWGIIWIFTGEIDMFMFWIGINFMFGFFSGFMVLSFAQAKEWFPTSISGTVIALVNTMVFSGAAVLQTISGFIIIEETMNEFGILWGCMFFCVVLACIISYLSRDNVGDTVAIKN